jgi:hypothetical protein
MTDTTQRDLGFAEGKLDAIEQTVNRIEGKLDKQSDRISTVENRQYYFMGAGGIVGSIVTFVFSKVFH